MYDSARRPISGTCITEFFYESNMKRVVNALYDSSSIVVYQAYNSLIAQSAFNAQTFANSDFKMDRMTWIKPSFLWMMYRSGWATKKDQEHILAITIKREGFEWALCNSCLSHFEENVYPSYNVWKEKVTQSPIRIQWDPEKDIFLQNLPHKAIQIGLSGIAVKKFIDDWVVRIEDITERCKTIHNLILQEKIIEAEALIPAEKPYELSISTAKIINSDYWI